MLFVEIADGVNQSLPSAVTLAISEVLMHCQPDDGVGVGLPRLAAP
jgi:hypothetical protein